MRTLTVILVLFLLPIATAQQYLWKPGLDQPNPEMGPDVPTSTEPIATVVAFENEMWAWTAGERTHSFVVPEGWNRVVMEYNQRPDGDPWDRLFVVLFDRVEVLRGTTPRTDFTVTKDVTRYASLLPQGGEGRVTVDTSAWEIGPQFVTLTLRFYNDPTSAVVEHRDQAVSGYANRGLCKDSVITQSVSFGASHKTSGVLEFSATGHGSEEEQFFSRHFDILVGGHPFASVYVFPYTYAIVGFYGGNDAQHPVMWWSAQRAADVVGVHTGPGEIPPYRLTLDAAQIDLMQGDKTVEVRAVSVYNCVWVTSLSFLLDE